MCTTFWLCFSILETWNWISKRVFQAALKSAIFHFLTLYTASQKYPEIEKKLDSTSELAALHLLASTEAKHHIGVVNWHQVSGKRPVSPSLDAAAPGRQLCLSLSNHLAWASLFEGNTYSSEHLMWCYETLHFSDDTGQGVTVNGHCWFPLVLSLAWH